MRLSRAIRYQGIDMRPPRPVHSGFTLIELLIVMSIIVSLTAIFTVSYPLYRSWSQREACKADLAQFSIGGAAYQNEWNDYPPSGNSALAGAMREGSRRGPPPARLVASRFKQIGIQEGANALKLSGGVQPGDKTIRVTPAQVLPAFADPATGEPLPMQFGAAKIDEPDPDAEDEWFTFTAVEDGTFQGCRRGVFGTRASKHSTGTAVVMYLYLDPWGTPYAYTRAKDYGKKGSDQALTRTGFCGTGNGCDTRFSQQPKDEDLYSYYNDPGEDVRYHFCFENCGEFQAVSAGPDLKFFRINPETGEPVDPKQVDDDIRNW